MTAPKNQSSTIHYPLFQEYFNLNPAWGSIHIILADGNLEDEHIDWCIDYAIKLGDTAAVDLCSILYTFSYSQRMKLYNHNWQWPS